jgi:hypothetical protein
VRAHKGDMRIDKTPTKQDSIRCPQCKETNAETLKRQRPIGEGDQELEKRLVLEELISNVTHMYRKAMRGIFCYSYPYIKQQKPSVLLINIILSLQQN